MNVRAFPIFVSHGIAFSDTVENMNIRMIHLSACLHLLPCLPELVNKPRISYNVTTRVSPGRRIVLLKWEVRFTLSLDTVSYVFNTLQGKTDFLIVLRLHLLCKRHQILYTCCRIHCVYMLMIQVLETNKEKLHQFIILKNH